MIACVSVTDNTVYSSLANDIHSSIAYITITGLEKLKAQTDAPEYVNIINDLAVTFEALCEVSFSYILTVFRFSRMKKEDVLRDVNVNISIICLY